MNYIGPRFPHFNGENCGCGGILVFIGNENNHSVWKCGLCESVRLGNPTKAVDTTIKHKDFMEDSIVTDSKVEKNEEN